MDAQGFVAAHTGTYVDFPLPAKQDHQCVALFWAFNREVNQGEAYSANGAADLWNIKWQTWGKIPPGGLVRYGDWASWSGTAGAYQNNGAGHTAMWTAPDPNYPGRQLDFSQNPNTPQIISLLPDGIQGYLRKGTVALYGPDVSGWQSGDMSKVAADLVIIKATGGTALVSSQCDAQFQSARASGKLTGLYHFAHEQGYGPSDAISEANYFVDQTAGYWDGKTLPILDWESDNVTDVAWALAWLKQVESRIGIKPWIYMSAKTCAPNNGINWSPVYNNDNGLWVAQYAVTTATQGYTLYDGTDPATVLSPDSQWPQGPAAWQFADNAQITGYSGGLDASVFYGDAATWAAYCSPAITEDALIYELMGEE